MKKTVIGIVVLAVLWMLIPVRSWAALSDIDNFCITPPFIQTPLLSNLLLLIDNSASMYDLSYTQAGADCYDSTYNNSSTYTGYFDYPRHTSDYTASNFQQKTGDYIYKYNMTTSLFEKVSAFPTTPTATYDTSYLYIHMTGTLPNRYVDSFYATGSFLNWLAMSKLDVQKKVLTGGKWISDATPYLNAQSRGCNGRRFIKSVPEADWIHKIQGTNATGDTVTTLNLAIRGPQASSEGFVSPATMGGTTKIEIYESTYSYAACQTAITYWQDQIAGNGVGTVGQQVQTCMNLAGSGNTAGGRENSNFTEWARDCVQIAQNIKNGLTTYNSGSPNAGILKNVTPSNFAGNCEAVYTATVANGGCGAVSNNGADATNQAKIEGCATLNNTGGGNYVCSRKTNLLNGSVLAPYNAADYLVPVANANLLNDGYAGSCWNGQTQGGSSSTHFAPTGDADCLARQLLHFCASSVASNVVDPSAGSAVTSTSGNIPAILVEAGLRSGGDPLPYGSSAGNRVMMTNIDAATGPTDGIIQKFADGIRLGVMTFNYDGSKSECYDPVPNPPTGLSTSQITCGRYCLTSTTPVAGTQVSCRNNADCTTAGESCQLIPQTDGAKIVPNAYIGDPVGNHTTGIIKAIDDIDAVSWTPFAEAMYNAIGYYAKDNDTGLSKWPGLQAGDYLLNRNPQQGQYACQSNNIILFTDGMSTADQNDTVLDVATWAASDPNRTGTAQTGYDTTNSCPKYGGSMDFDDLVWLGRHKNINSLDISTSATLHASPAPLDTDRRHRYQFINTFIVSTGADEPSMPGQCNPTTLLTAAAANGGPTSSAPLYQVTTPTSLWSNIYTVFSLVAGNAASGTAASILSNSEGSGAALLQALFYPSKAFDQNTMASWLGELQSFWYYLDPNLQKTSIREDTNRDYTLNLIDDKVVQFYFDTDDKTKVNKYADANGDGAADSTTPDAGFAGVSPETVNSLWMAGRNLWNRDVTTNAGRRTIYTGYNSSIGNTPQLFDETDTANFNKAAVWDIMQIPSGGTITGTQRQGLMTKLINYVQGSDPDPLLETAPCLLSGCKYRSRKVTISSYCDEDATVFTPCTHEWKLGDIISSTPKLVSNVHINNYNLRPPTGYSDSTYAKYVTSSTYANRGMAFVGANDGMLHAFKLGIMNELKDLYEKARLTTSTGSTVTSALRAELGQEAWAYIPKHALPYLKYLAEPTYNHLYYVDKSPLILDASIGVPTGCATDYSKCTKSSDGSTWRTILIGGMGIGGASREQGTTSATAVQPPIAGVGYSSYFALDVTNPAEPKYMWEFFGDTSDGPKLGYSTSGPAIVRIAAKVNPSAITGNPDNSKNGKWFAVFASGPLGPIVAQEFKGQSDQPLYLFIVDLATGTLVRTINCGTEFDLGLTAAFAGSLASSTIDTDRNNQAAAGYYSDDAVYIGYTRKCTASDTGCTTGEWTKGGVLRLTTKESTNPNDTTNGWVVSKLISDIGPVTTSVSKLQDWKNNNLWIYFGTGRFFYKNDDYSSSSVQQAIYGLQDPCYVGGNSSPFNKNCTDPFSKTIIDQSGTGSAPATSLASTEGGWKIVLDNKDTTNNYATERVITDPLASPSGAVFFTTFKPSSDLCQYGGDSLLWAVRYDTGATPPATAMQGKALMQVSTGAFQEITLSSAFSNPGSTRYNGRRLATPITGVPPTSQGLSLFSNPMPVKKILHYQEK